MVVDIWLFPFWPQTQANPLFLPLRVSLKNKKETSKNVAAAYYIWNANRWHFAHAEHARPMRSNGQAEHNTPSTGGWVATDLLDPNCYPAILRTINYKQFDMPQISSLLHVSRSTLALSWISWHAPVSFLQKNTPLYLHLVLEDSKRSRPREMSPVLPANSRHYVS